MNLNTAAKAFILAMLLAVFGANTVGVSAQSGAVHDVGLASAMRVVDAALKKAKELDTKMNIAVLDSGGNLKAFVRMDGAYLGSADIAIKKAKTSRLFNAPSGVIGGMSQPGGPLYGIEGTNGGLVTFAGGLPLANSDGVVVGSIGVSGSTVENDLIVAQAGADVF